ncbi:uncharacterized protein [Ptychodera flava]|uniref:uncharacterized protein n=1 Tax=Ptychodera flava TaxID=63121 RepID=UPI00396A9485
MPSKLKTFCGFVSVLVAIAATVVACATPTWEYNRAYGLTTVSGLWTTCAEYEDQNWTNKLCNNIGITKVDAAIRYCRFACIFGAIVALGALVVPIIVCQKKKWIRALNVASVLIMACGVNMLCATIWYALKIRDSENELRYGYSLILAWGSIPFYIVGGVMLILGFKDDEPKDYMASSGAV